MSRESILPEWLEEYLIKYVEEANRVFKDKGVDTLSACHAIGGISEGFYACFKELDLRSQVCSCGCHSPASAERIKDLESSLQCKILCIKDQIKAYDKLSEQFDKLEEDHRRLSNEY